MADLELKSNSLRIRFPRGCKEPNDKQIFEFIKTKLGLKHDMLLAMYKEKLELSVIVKFKSESDLKAILDNHRGTMVFCFDEHSSCEVELSAANAVVRYVRLFNLPPEIEDREVWSVMARFGKVQRTVREKYGAETGFPIWTSVRGVYIQLNEGVEIPASVHVRNIRARIFYEGLINKCFQCGNVGHLKADCSSRRSVNDRLRLTNDDEISHVVNADTVQTQPTYSQVASVWTKVRVHNTSPLATTENVAAQSELTNLNVLFPDSKPRRNSLPAAAGAGTHKPLETTSNVTPIIGESSLLQNDATKPKEISTASEQMEVTESSLKRDRKGERRGINVETESTSYDASESDSGTEKLNTLSGMQSARTRNQKKKILKMRLSNGNVENTSCTPSRDGTSETNPNSAANNK